MKIAKKKQISLRSFASFWKGCNIEQMPWDHGLSACKLPPDAWALIGLHLKPRYLALLIRTSKQIKQLVDNEEYWTRVAFHMVWRGKDCIEVGDDDFSFYPYDNLPPLKENLYDLLALEVGYYQGMELFIKRVDEAIIYWRSQDRDSEECCAYWDKFKTMSLKEKTLDHNLGPMPQENLQMTMKEVAKKHMLKSLSEPDKIYNAFVLDLEDDPMPAKYKRQVMKKIRNMLWLAYGTDNDMCPLYTSALICKFGKP
jgi:hypothetical protein